MIPFVFLPLLWVILSSIICFAVAETTYQLDTLYEGSTFFDGFNFYTSPDPTHGFVNYLSEDDARAAHLVLAGNGGPAYMSVDAANKYDASAYYYDGFKQGGRPSVRIASKKTWTHALIISDIAHMPGGICDWTIDEEWPRNGEIDIIEGVNRATDNLMSLHTSSGCTVAGADQTGELQTSDCDANVNQNSGCGVSAHNAATYGTQFNANNGGVFATEWTSDFIRIWFWSRGQAPADINNGLSPDPSGWGLPLANFQGNCSIDDHFQKHAITFDTTFCGDYAGNTFGSDPFCREQAQTCNEFVADNPTAFQNAYWAVNSVKVFQKTNIAATSSGPASTGPTSTAASLTPVAPKSSVQGPGMGASDTSFSSIQPSSTNPGPESTGLSSIVPGLPSSILESFSIKGLPTSSSIQSSTSNSVSALESTINEGSSNVPFPSIVPPPGSTIRPSTSPLSASSSSLSSRSRSYTLSPTSSATSVSSAQTSLAINSSPTLSSISPTLTGSVSGGGLPNPSPVPSSQVAASSTTSPPVSAVSSTINSFRYLGCYGSLTGFPTFSQADDSPSMSLEACTLACHGYAYAGVFTSKCFCGSALDNSTSANSAGAGACDIPCPGNLTESCGGYAYGMNSGRRNADAEFPGNYGLVEKVKRQAVPNNVLLTLYETESAVNGSVSSSISTISVGSGSYTGFGAGAPLSSIFLVLTTVFTSLCPTSSSPRLYTAVLTTLHCGCSESPYPSIPMTTEIKTCPVCGEHEQPGTTTMTIPCSSLLTEGGYGVLTGSGTGTIEEKSGKGSASAPPAIGASGIKETGVRATGTSTITSGGPTSAKTANQGGTTSNPTTTIFQGGVDHVKSFMRRLYFVGILIGVPAAMCFWI